MSPRRGPYRAGANEAPPRAEFSLASAVDKRREEEGGWVALARAIDAANRRPDEEERRKRFALEPRRLRAIVAAHDSLTLSLRELRALDRYLEPYGQGLATRPLFLRPNLIEALAREKNVTFLLGSRAMREWYRVDFSHWDVLAMAEIQRRVNALAPEVRFDIKEVRFEPERLRLPGAAEEGEWVQQLRPEGPSIVCLASSAANPATEAILCRFFGERPYQPEPLEHRRKLPFHFVWSKRHPIRSSFQLDPADIARKAPDEADQLGREDTSGIVYGNEVLVDKLTAQRSGRSLGLCAAQRQSNGRIWLVLAGVTGQATYAAACLTGEINVELPPGAASPVYHGLIEAQVAPAPEGSKDPPQVESQSILRNPRAWPEPSAAL